MAEISGISAPVSDVMLARYVAGDLQGAQLARVERAIGETPGLAERLERMKNEREGFLASPPTPQQFAHQVVTRLTVERAAPASKWQVWWLLPPVTVAATLLFGVVYRHALGPQSLAPSAVTTDEAFELPVDAPDAKGEPPAADASARAAAAPDPEAAPIELAKTEQAFDKAATRAGADAPRDLDRKAKKVTRDADDVVPDGNARVRLPREGHVSKDTPGGAPGGQGGAGGIGAIGSAYSESSGKGYAQPPATGVAPSTQPAPAPAKPVAPPVWAAPPPPAPTQTPARREAPADAERDQRQANKAPAAEAKPQVNAGPAASSTVASEDELARAPAKMKAEEKRSRMADSGDVAAKEDADKTVSTSVQITREQHGRVRNVVSSEAVPAGGLLKVTAQGSKYVTVIGVRRDGAPYVYGQGTSVDQQPVTIAMRMRPSSSRTTEAVFVVLTEAPLVVQKDQIVAGGKDAGQLPLRLTVPGQQRRFVINVSAAAEE